MRKKFRLKAGRRRTRHEPGTMNKTEAAFASLLDNSIKARLMPEYWSDAKTAPDEYPVWYLFEGIKLRLAANTFYTPDFFVTSTHGRVVAYEIKGFWEDDARVKIKVAARTYPWVDFIACKFTKKEGWTYESIKR